MLESLAACPWPLTSYTNAHMLGGISQLTPSVEGTHHGRWNLQISPQMMFWHLTCRIWHSLCCMVLDSSFRLCLSEPDPAALAQCSALFEKEAPCTLPVWLLNNRITTPSASSRWELAISMQLLRGSISEVNEGTKCPCPLGHCCRLHTMCSGSGLCTTSASVPSK